MKRSLLLGLLLCLTFLVAPTAEAAKIPGMDISKYQGDIDWAKVGKSNIEFVFIRATHGDYVDERYLENTTGATEQGLPWTAYAYGDPRKKEGTAVEQADLFIEAAGLGKGNILPVLDMETAGGLGRERLQDWVAQWLRRVKNKLGVKAIIYTNPSFWQSELGDTQRFARRGHKLWIANWFVHSPEVPAGNWAGKGWSFWQWTDQGSVSGINGDVDRDWFAGSKIGPRYRIR